MTREKLVAALEDMRDMQMRCFEDYCKWMQEGPTERQAFRGLRDNADQRVRALDYLITEMKKDEFVRN